MTTVRCVRDYCIVRPDEDNFKTAGGIIIPDTAKETPDTGVLVAVSSGYYEGGIFVTPDVYVNERVIYTRYSATDLELEGALHHLIRLKDILGVIQ